MLMTMNFCFALVNFLVAASKLEKLMAGHDERIAWWINWMACGLALYACFVCWHLLDEALKKDKRR